ncbi:hypothetical protein [Sphingomonas sp. PAMC 26621]|uniref:hypothetical protein n=1 Tax=Sphingomonas sp. PAMC 26621 TaxID=1112213 RepID=UPI000287DCB4|nr:hypothetical protein [Sphingomonas sp. PAMC 26621]
MTAPYGARSIRPLRVVGVVPVLLVRVTPIAPVERITRPPRPARLDVTDRGANDATAHARKAGTIDWGRAPLAASFPDERYDNHRRTRVRRPAPRQESTSVPA